MSCTSYLYTVCGRYYIILYKQVDLLLSKPNDLINVVWFSNNKLNINASKSNLDIFLSADLFIPNSMFVFICNTRIQSTFSAVLLGIELDKHLKFNLHVALLTPKVAYAISLKVHPLIFRFSCFITLSFISIESHHVETVHYSFISSPARSKSSSSNIQQLHVQCIGFALHAWHFIGAKTNIFSTFTYINL